MGENRNRRRRTSTVAQRLAGLPLLGRFLGGDPLLRNGVVLTLASLASSVLGAAYWSVVGPGLHYSTSTVGRNYSAVSMVMFLGGVSQLNLADVMVRFAPSAGSATRRIVTRAYLASIALALLVGVGFVLLVPWVSPGLGFLHTPLTGTVFVVAVVAYGIFILQDGVLTGLRRPSWVLGEQLLFSLSKLVAVALFALSVRDSGILLSWTVALLLALLYVNTYLFGFAIPAREREVSRMERRPSWARDAQPGDVTGLHLIPAESTAGLVRFTAATYVGGLFWLAASTLPQVLILDTLGARDSAYFSISWVITTMLYVISINMGSSIVVESAGDPKRLAKAVRTVLRGTGALLLGGAAALIAAAPLVLRLFGSDYPGHATALLRLLALSSLPNLIIATALAAYRVRRRAVMVVVVYGATCALVFGLFQVLVPRFGLAGMGLAWLVTQVLVAAALLVFRDSWLPRPPRTPAPPPLPRMTIPQQRDRTPAEEEH
ncbi:lipopolysaccharide biosynthesis protein [Streptacidiphilus sp. P02-A3a]|uniref:lipopolysaccharide biosynthesis protein n=1 Tax=Streptacidiphilus sp. P02-A3a TaxID=2704468 RepID=UPI0015F9D3B8|nr:hypothetical protein [Streptacidiphilus sp. P02-A3a]QMU71972.1 hypothetical protein GXP74_30790 [Streptacidiphilus sp. P02-A3a]